MKHRKSTALQGNTEYFPNLNLTTRFYDSMIFSMNLGFRLSFTKVIFFDAGFPKHYLIMSHLPSCVCPQSMGTGGMGSTAVEVGKKPQRVQQHHSHQQSGSARRPFPSAGAPPWVTKQLSRGGTRALAPHICSPSQAASSSRHNTSASPLSLSAFYSFDTE